MCASFNSFHYAEHQNTIIFIIQSVNFNQTSLLFNTETHASQILFIEYLVHYYLSMPIRSYNSSLHVL